jgi:hypothetical protein
MTPAEAKTHAKLQADERKTHDVLSAAEGKHRAALRARVAFEKEIRFREAREQENRK